jgi:hypothetical protein
MKFLSDFIGLGISLEKFSETLFLFLRPQQLHFVASLQAAIILHRIQTGDQRGGTNKKTARRRSLR